MRGSIIIFTVSIIFNFLPIMAYAGRSATLTLSVTIPRIIGVNVGVEEEKLNQQESEENTLQKKENAQRKEKITLENCKEGEKDESIVETVRDGKPVILKTTVIK